MRTAVTLICVVFVGGGHPTALADRISNPVAMFAGLDKITGDITPFEVGIGATKQFGALMVRPRVCYSRSPEDEPKTTSFVEVDEVQPDKKSKRIFTGWMLAESPGLSAVENPVYDIWLTACVDPSAPKAQISEQFDPVAIDPESEPKDND
ncbi:MAG: DUF2155 domain-containing protein [Pseudomonadota bacterium]|nr:DUF2155 domain-containing protein [Pseudomonadota bacterium]